MNNIILFCVSLVCLKGVFGETISVKVGDPVTLNTGLTAIPKGEVIEWRFGDNLVARVENNKDPAAFGNFKGRLELNRQTGTLTINTTKTTDSGQYNVSNTKALMKTFNVNVNVNESGGADSGLSGGAIAGIVIGVVLVVCAIAVGIYFGVQKSKQML